MNKEIFRVIGKPEKGSFDKCFLGKVAVIRIGGKVVSVGTGYKEYDKNEDHLRWKLDEDEEYEVILREVTEETERMNRFSEFTESERSELITALRKRRKILTWKLENRDNPLRKHYEDWMVEADTQIKEMVDKLINELEKTFK